MSFSRSPKILKGAFVQIDSSLPTAERVVVFQYNPEKLDRRLVRGESAQPGWERPERRKLLNPKYAPRESIFFNLILDASDKLENPEDNTNTVKHGIYPQLSALEMLLYPEKKSSMVNSVLHLLSPKSAKKRTLTLLVWGKQRIIPVLITELNIIEEMFDNNLNPIRANVEVKMDVLKESDSSLYHKGPEHWESYITNKINMADKAYSETNIGDIITF